MEVLERLGPGDVVSAVTRYRDALREHRDAINRLNVYPVPDGDTGTNMALTLDSVVTELDQLDGSGRSMADVCRALSHGSLMGARGNSGVILSQVLRGLADGFAPLESVGPAELSAALTGASDAAYQAVMRPVEGTILTVVRESAEAAAGVAGAGGALVDVLDAARTAGVSALDSTPELLPVLKQAGVVDAGGAGLLLLLDSMLAVTDGREVALAARVPAGAATGPARDSHSALRAEAHAEGDVSNLRYEVMYLLEAPDDAIPAFKEVWAGIGDSIVVVGGQGLWNCHIHTDDVGAAIESALDAGRPRRIRVTDLIDQVEEERWVREAAGDLGDPESDAWTGEPPATAVVAVATGGGLRRIFRSLGVHQIVAGGQSMNPSTAQILEAVEAAPSDQVIVLPNNKNIVPVAEQVRNLTSKEVRVVATSGIPEGFAALMAYDPEADADENAHAMKDATQRVISAEVTQAVRAARSDAGAIQEGDWLGLSRDGIEVVASDVESAARALLQKLVTDEHEIVCIIEGEGSSAADTRRLTEWLDQNHPGVSAEVHHGGQPLYPYLFSIE